MATLSTPGWVIFSIDEQRYGLPCALIKRITRVVEITPIPNMPTGVLGLINVQGQIILIIDIRQRLGLPARDCTLQDVLVIAQDKTQPIGFIVNELTYAENFESSVTQVQNLMDSVKCIKKVVKDAEGILYILDLENLLNPYDEQILQDNKYIQQESNG